MPDRPAIHTLSPEIIRLIAAGEVIERPASVVKELIENSLDAGAKHIEIKLVNGGLNSITVRDDGCGISSAEVPLLLHRHTTSKIANESDLESILTLGFRGEALYSIAAASDMILSTRFAGEDSGTRLSWENNEKTVEPISWPGGTQVESLSLFHSTPARRKFLRSDSAEYSRAASLVSSYALAYPHVSWKLIHNGRETFRSPGTGNLDDALAAVYGIETARKMIPVDFHAGDRNHFVKITGAVSSIEIHRARRTDQIFFLNGRLIKDASITATLERPYMQFLPQGRHPIAVLQIECDPRMVDVNVHPHKREVRLADPHAISGAVYHAVANTLRKTDPLNRTRQSADENPMQDDFSIDKATGEVFPSTSLPPTSLAERIQGRELRESERKWAIREPKHRHTADWPTGDIQNESGTRPGAKPASTQSLQHIYPSFDELDVPDDLPPIGHSMQFANTYIIYNQGHAVWLIDQHNLHERILFEEFIHRESSSPVTSQSLLFPLQVTLTPSLAVLVADHLDDLAALGFEIEEFSQGTGVKSFVLRSVPQSLRDSDPARAFTDILECAVNDEEISGEGGFRRSFIINLSCKSAIKAGKPLTEDEIRYLVEHIRDATYLTCPHGRPTVIRLDEDWFRKAFRRS